MASTPEISSAEDLARAFLEMEGEQIVRDMAGHVGDELHRVIKRHATMMATTGGAIGVGVLVAAQVLGETAEFARRSCPENAHELIEGIAALFVTLELDPALRVALAERLAA